MYNYQYIIDPNNNKIININTDKGKKIIKKYINMSGGKLQKEWKTLLKKNTNHNIHNYDYIISPFNNLPININSIKGELLIKNYINTLKGGSGNSDSPTFDSVGADATSLIEAGSAAAVVYSATSFVIKEIAAFASLGWMEHFRAKMLNGLLKPFSKNEPETDIGMYHFVCLLYYFMCTKYKNDIPLSKDEYHKSIFIKLIMLVIDKIKDEYKTHVEDIDTTHYEIKNKLQYIIPYILESCVDGQPILTQDKNDFVIRLDDYILNNDNISNKVSNDHIINEKGYIFNSNVVHIYNKINSGIDFNEKLIKEKAKDKEQEEIITELLEDVEESSIPVNTNILPCPTNDSYHNNFYRVFLTEWFNNKGNKNRKLHTMIKLPTKKRPVTRHYFNNPPFNKLKKIINKLNPYKMSNVESRLIPDAVCNGNGEKDENNLNGAQESNDNRYNKFYKVHIDMFKERPGNSVLELICQTYIKHIHQCIDNDTQEGQDRLDVYDDYLEWRNEYIKINKNHQGGFKPFKEIIAEKIIDRTFDAIGYDNAIGNDI